MSFQHKNFWMPRDAGCLAEENMGYENSSRIEAKRGHEWFTNTGEPQVFRNKKQAIETVSGNPISGVSHVNISPWDTNSGFQSATSQFSDSLFGSELRNNNLVEKNVPSVRSGNLNIGRKDFENQYGNDSSVGLSISHTIDDPSSCFYFGGIRKVKVNQVRDADNCMSSSMWRSYGREDNNTISIGSGYGKNDGNDHAISLRTPLSKTDDSLVSMSHTFNKGGGSFMLMGPNYGRGDENILSMSQPFHRGDGNFISMGQSYEMEDNMISLATSYYKGHENLISMGPTHRRSEENLMTIAASYGKDADHIISVGPTYDNVYSNIASTIPSYERGDSSSLPAGGVISSYNQSMGNQASVQNLEGQKALVESNADWPVNNSTPKSLRNKEPKTTKKAPANNFPSNVKSLLSTGIFDGVPVKYVSWSRERNLKGIIKGTGYLCSCDDCKQSKALNAYEFERHAGAKTKHPNNHIYFENGKTIYSVVQELKNTSQEMLFDAIQNVTGSSIHEKNFHTWKASYQAATRELQRIYGKDEVIVLS